MTEVGGCRYEEAFGRVLDMADVGRVTWLCQQLDAAELLNQEPLPLSQSVLLSLMQQLGSDLARVRLLFPSFLHTCSTSLPAPFRITGS